MGRGRSDARGMRRARYCVPHEVSAQATVEMAAVTPVLIVLALIVYNVMTFVAATARFDRAAPDIVLAHGSAPVSGADGGAGASDASAVIAQQLEAAMGDYRVEIEVTCEQSSSDSSDSVLSLMGSLKTYRCVMRYAPWPSGFSIAGVNLGAPAFLTHERPVTIDPWRSGVVV